MAVGRGRAAGDSLGSWGLHFIQSVFAVCHWPVASWTRRPPKRTEQKWAVEAEIVVNCPSQGPDLAVSPVTLIDEGVRVKGKACVGHHRLKLGRGKCALSPLQWPLNGGILKNAKGKSSLCSRTTRYYVQPFQVKSLYLKSP